MSPSKGPPERNESALSTTEVVAALGGGLGGAALALGVAPGSAVPADEWLHAATHAHDAKRHATLPVIPSRGCFDLMEDMYLDPRT
jgi:hypothetical protein